MSNRTSKPSDDPAIHTLRSGEHYCIVCGRHLRTWTVDGLCARHECWVSAGVVRVPLEIEEAL